MMLIGVGCPAQHPVQARSAETRCWRSQHLYSRWRSRQENS